MNLNFKKSARLKQKTKKKCVPVIDLVAWRCLKNSWEIDINSEDEVSTWVAFYYSNCNKKLFFLSSFSNMQFLRQKFKWILGTEVSQINAVWFYFFSLSQLAWMPCNMHSLWKKLGTRILKMEVTLWPSESMIKLCICLFR